MTTNSVKKDDSNMDIWLNHSRDLESFKIMGAQEFRDHQDKSVHAKKSFRTNKQILALENERKKEIKDNLINSNPYLSKAFERNKKFVNQYGKTFLSYKIHQDNTYILITVTNPYISKLKKKKDYTVHNYTSSYTYNPSLNHLQ